MTKLAIVLGVLCGVSGAARAGGPPEQPSGPSGSSGATPNGTVSVRGEVIEVHGSNPLQVPTPKTDSLKIPPYSDKAVLGNHWSHAWLLLDVDERGVVSRLKLLKRPGNDLDAIAVKFGFDLRFDPARDDHGVPKRSYVVWPLEWPAVGWLQSRDMLMNKLSAFPTSAHVEVGEARATEEPQVFVNQPRPMADPVEQLVSFPRLTSGIVVFDGLPACAGGRGLNLDETELVQRDCSAPDLSLAASEPWIVRGADMPVPVVEAAPIIDPVKYREEQVASARLNRRLAYVTAVAASALAVATVASYTEMHKYADRVNTDETDRLVTTPAQLAADRSKLNRWELATIAAGGAALVSGVASVHLFRSESQLMLLPSGDGAGLAYAGRF